MQKAFTFKSLWSSSGVLRSYPSTATLTAEKDQAPKRRSPVKGHVTFKLTACTAVLSGRPHSGMRPSCARCHSNAVFVTTENGRLWVGQELKPGETRKRNTSFSWEQPESSSHGQLFFTVCSYPGLCLLVCLEKTTNKTNTLESTSVLLWPPRAHIQRRDFFQTGLWLVPATNGFGWLGIVLVQQDGIADLWKYPSAISFLVLYLSKVISTSVIPRGDTCSSTPTPLRRYKPKL